MQSAQTLAQVAKDLLTDERFKHEFKTSKTPKGRRIRIQSYGMQMGMPAEVDKIKDRESTRLLLEHLLNADDCNVGTPTEPSYSLAQMLQAYDELPAPNTNTNTPTPATKENTMSKVITVTTQVNVNGVNADNYTDAQLFDMIRQQENEIKNLQALTNKPQSLLREIKTRQEGIDALVNFMNERDAKLNPQPAQPAKPTGPDLQTLQGSV